MPPQATYVFKHALIQGIAYDSLLRSARQGYHRRIAEVLEAQFPETAETQPELLGHHLTEAGLHELAVSYWRQAGEKSIQRSANMEAIAHLTQALELLKPLPGAPERDLQELTLQQALGVSLFATKGAAAPEVEAAYARARELCQQVGDPSHVLPMLYGLWGRYNQRMEWRTARELAEEMLTLAERHQESGYLLMAHLALGATFFYLGEFVAARSHLEQSMALYDRDRHRNYAYIYGRDPLMACQAMASWALYILGYPDQALIWSESALTWAQQLAHPYSIGHALTNVIVVYQLHREWQAALDRAQMMIALATEHGFQQWIGQATRSQGFAQAMLGNKEGIAQVLQGDAVRARTGARMRSQQCASTAGRK